MTEAAAAARLDAWRRAVDGALARRFPPGRARLRQAIRYSLLAEGKRVRPVLVLASAELAGAPRRAALAVACAIEMIHTYSLVHDDLPAMDDDDLRRGRPTSHRVFGEGLAILVGDALLTEAFATLAAIPGVPAARGARVAAEIAAAAGERGMVGGQARDLAAQQTRLGLRALSALHAAKTGALLRASVRAGALLGAAPPRLLARLGAYGTALGLAFQIVDDVLDAAGEAAHDGRTDAALAKATYPALLGDAAARREARRATARALAALGGLGARAEALRLVARRVVARMEKAAPS